MVVNVEIIGRSIGKSIETLSTPSTHFVSALVSAIDQRESGQAMRSGDLIRIERRVG